MHFLFVWSYWQYPEVALEFLSRISALGHRVSVILGDVEGAFDHRSISDLDFYFANKWNYFSKITGTPYPVFRNIESLIRVLRPDIVHVNSHLFLSNYQAARVACSLDLPVVVTVHGVVARRGFLLDRLQDVYSKTFGRSLFKMAETVICLTENDASAVAKLVGSYDKISVIPNGVDVDFFSPSFDRIEGLVVWVGRLVPEKGLPYLLRAMQEVVREFPYARLVLLGEGISRVELTRLTHQLGLSNYVKFLGGVRRIDVAKNLSKASVFAFPSLREGLPFSVLEAMACGVPVVGSDISGINDVIDNGLNGLLVPPRESAALAKAITSVLKDNERRRAMSEAARNKMVKNYSWPNIIKKIDDVYRAVV